MDVEWVTLQLCIQGSPGLNLETGDWLWFSEVSAIKMPVGIAPLPSATLAVHYSSFPASIYVLRH
jgi:hypothetical protein